VAKSHNVVTRFVGESTCVHKWLCMRGSAEGVGIRSSPCNHREQRVSRHLRRSLMDTRGVGQASHDTAGPRAATPMHPRPSIRGTAGLTGDFQGARSALSVLWPQHTSTAVGTSHGYTPSPGAERRHLARGGPRRRAADLHARGRPLRPGAQRLGLGAGHLPPRLTATRQRPPRHDHQPIRRHGTVFPLLHPPCGSAHRRAGLHMPLARLRGTP
jgi:hypothetical protein